MQSRAIGASNFFIRKQPPVLLPTIIHAAAQGQCELLHTGDESLSALEAAMI